MPVLVVMEAIWVLEFEHRAAVQHMLTSAARNPGDLPDLLIAETARLAG
ncbi:MAG: hypothetical protein ACNA7W_09755 [Pseudomonadales bacterium]